MSVAGRVPLADAIRRDAGTGLDFLPTVRNDSDFVDASETLASPAAKALFTSLKMQYDYVIVDLAPMVAGAGVDLRASGRLVDSYILVIEWGRTRVDAVQYALRHAPELQNRIMGAVLNKVDLATIQRYGGYDAHYYYGRYYGRDWSFGPSELTMSQIPTMCPALVGSKRWFLVHTLPKKERKAELHLAAQGFRTYLAAVSKNSASCASAQNNSITCISALSFCGPGS